MGSYSIALHVLRTDELGTRCATDMFPNDPFWLPSRYVAWVEPLAAGKFQTAIIAGWLAETIWQLRSDAAYR
jgi:hypothetical protein